MNRSVHNDYHGRPAGYLPSSMSIPWSIYYIIYKQEQSQIWKIYKTVSIDS